MNEYSSPSWNNDTACLQTLHRNMAEQGWDHWRPSISLCDFDFGHFRISIGFELPRRPLDLGEGLWR
jgi:hypothetical protein